MFADIENYNVRQRNSVNDNKMHREFPKSENSNNSFEINSVNGQIITRPYSAFNNRLNSERMHDNGGMQAKRHGTRKPKQYNNRVYKPVPKEDRVKPNDNPFVISINSNDTELCKANMARLYHMHHSTHPNMQLQRHLDMVAKGTDFLLCQQQANLVQFHEDLRRYQENALSNVRKIES